MDNDSILNHFLALHSLSRTQVRSEQALDFILQTLLRKEEAEAGCRDQWDNFEFPYTLNDYSSPYLDKLLGKFSVAQTDSGCIWGKDARFGVWLTHDLDLVSGSDPVPFKRRFNQQLKRGGDALTRLNFLLRYARYGWKALWSHKEDELWCYDKLLDLEKSHGFSSTFFVFARPESAQEVHYFDCDYTFNDRIGFRGKKMRVGDFIGQLSSEGFEIGCHPSYLSWTNPDMILDQKRRIEAVSGSELKASRQHFLHFDSEETPSALYDAGFRIDSTLGFNRTVGFRAGTSFPFYWSSGLLEVPLIIMDSALFRDNALEFNAPMAERRIMQIMDMVEECKGILTINFHPNYLNDPVWWRVYHFILRELEGRRTVNLNGASIIEKVAQVHVFDS
jgi:peptidoglycan/xylan/chitin deacetylase (PgdA/CDA1 family)